jgi:hypothetical protein
MLQKSHEAYTGPRDAGIRLTEPLAPGMGDQYGAVAAVVLESYHLFDKAHLVMLGEEDLIPRADASAMLAALRDVEAQGMVEVRNEVGGGMRSAA